MANKLKLRDRDAIETAEGLIFRVFGYSHPPSAYICDAEYASSKIFPSTDPRAPRTGKDKLYYKFYNDEGMKLVAKKYPQYMVFHEMLGLNLVGVKDDAIAEARKPEVRLQALLEAGPTDELLAAMERVLNDSAQQFRLKDAGFRGFRLDAAWFSSSKVFRHRLHSLRQKRKRQNAEKHSKPSMLIRARVCVTSLNQTKPWRARIGDSKTSRLKISFGISAENRFTGYTMIKPAGEPLKPSLSP